MRKSVVAGIVGAFVLLGTGAPAQVLPPDIQPISQDFGISDSPKIAISGSNVYVMWRSDGAGIGVTGQQILFRRSTNYGITFEPVQVLSDDTAGGEVRDPTIAAVGSRVFVAWAQRVCDGTCSYEIFISRSVDGGATVDPAINLSAALDGQDETRARRPLTYSAVGDDIMPALAADGNYLYLVWASESVGTFDIWFARWNIGTGDFSDPDLLLNLSNSYKGTTKLDSRGDARNPAIAVDGSFVHVAWADNHRKPGTNFAIYTVSGSQRGADLERKRPKKMTTVSQRTGRQRTVIGDALCPALAAHNNSAFLAWSEQRDGRFEILFSSSVGGKSFAKPTLLSPSLKGALGAPPGDSLCPALVAGRFDLYLSWPDNTPGNFEIIALTNPTAPDPTARVTNLSQSWGDSEQIALALDSNERLYAIWTDKSSGKPEIYYRGRQQLTTSTASVSGTTRPMTRLSAQGGIFVVEANSADAAGIELEVFTLHGRRVAHLSAEGQRLEFRPVAENGAWLANGVYLYVVTVRSHDGTAQRSEVRKLVILR